MKCLKIKVRGREKKSEVFERVTDIINCFCLLIREEYQGNGAYTHTHTHKYTHTHTQIHTYTYIYSGILKDDFKTIGLLLLGKYENINKV